MLCRNIYYSFRTRYTIMHALMLYPLFPKSYWSFEKALQLAGRKVLMPPLGLITVAAILPQEWEYKLVDRNIRNVTEADWEWADLILLSGMIVQSADFLALIQEAKKRGKKVVVGGPYATALPQECKEAGADYLVLDEGELTIPMFLEALANEEQTGTFRTPEKPDLTTTPIPRFDLLELDAYSEMAVQFSRGCPFLCEFCDIIVLYGRRPRTKSPQQFIDELQCLYEMGWRRTVFVVDDNFIGNKRRVKEVLRMLVPWMETRDYPFSFGTEASIDLTKDQELMDLMTAANFGTVFLGIETPDEESLAGSKKTQNLNQSLVDSVHQITRSGLRVMAGFIIGFDEEKSGAGDRIVQFTEDASIPTALFSMLQALPGTALWHRLEKEGRLGKKTADGNQITLLNFIPNRPIEEIAEEYVNAFWDLYDPQRYLDRTYQHYRMLGSAPCHKERNEKKLKIKEKTSWKDKRQHIKAAITICFKQGLQRKTRYTFWCYLWSMYRQNPGGVVSYLTVCAQIEHFLEYRQIIKTQIKHHLATQTTIPADVKNSSQVVRAPLASEFYRT